MKSVKLFVRSISLRILYWLYWKLGNRSARDAYSLLEGYPEALQCFYRTIEVWKVIKKGSKKIKEVTENNLRAILLILLEHEVGHWIGAGRTDTPFLRDHVEEIVGNLSFYGSSVFSYDGIETRCIIDSSAIGEEIIKLTLMIQLLLERNGQDFFNVFHES